jgi:hypothetical protein
MSIESRLREKSTENARNLAMKLPIFQRELESALANVSELNRKIEIAEAAQERAQSFESRLGARFQCPHCWIESHTRADLESISAEDFTNVFQCTACGRIEKFYAKL